MSFMDERLREGEGQGRPGRLPGGARGEGDPRRRLAARQGSRGAGADRTGGRGPREGEGARGGARRRRRCATRRPTRAAPRSRPSTSQLRQHKGVTPGDRRASASRCRTTSRPSPSAPARRRASSRGLNSETKPFIPAFEIVKMRPGMKRASSVFVMAWEDRVCFYADCSMNIAPDAETLAEIGRATARARAPSATSRGSRSCRSRPATARRTPRSTG